MSLPPHLQRLLACSAMTIAMAAVAPLEGRLPHAYLDLSGVPTICYGHTKHVKLGQTLSKAECDALLAHDLGEALSVVDSTVTQPLPEARRAALASFVFNAGTTAFKESRLLKKLNAGQTQAACDELMRWVYAGRPPKHPVAGLIRRRAIERQLCLAPVPDSPSHPETSL